MARGGVGDLHATLGLNIDPWVTNLNAMERATQQTMRRIERDTKKSIDQIQRDMGRDARGRFVSTKGWTAESLQYHKGMISSLDPGGGAGQRLDNIAGGAAVAMSRARREGTSFLDTTIKAAMAMQGMRLAVDASVVGAKIMTGELRGIRQIAEAMKGLPIVGGVIGSGVGAYDYATAQDLKDQKKADQKALDRFNSMKGAATFGAMAELRGAASGAEFGRGLVGMSDRDAEIARRREQLNADVQAVRDKVTELQKLGTLEAGVEQQAAWTIVELQRQAMADEESIRERHYERRREIILRGVRAEREMMEKQYSEQQQAAYEHFAKLTHNHAKMVEQLKDLGRSLTQELAGLAQDVVAWQDEHSMLDARIKAGGLQAVGRDAEAQLAMTEESYRQQIAQAMREGDRAKAGKLLTLFGMEARDIQGSSGGTFGQNETGRFSFVSARTGETKALRIAEDSLRRLAELITSAPGMN